MESFFLLFCSIWFVVGGGIFAAFSAAGGPVWEDWILDLKGKPVLATPFDIRSTGSSVNRQRVQEIRFRFFDDTGREVESGSGTTDRSLLERARMHAQLPVHFDPGKPERARIDGTRISFFGFFTLIPFAAFAGGGYGLYRTVRNALRKRRLLSHGMLATGKVLSVDGTGTRLNNRQVLAIRYTFSGPQGSVEGTMKSFVARPVGTAVTVLYDPNDPSRSCLPVPGTFGPA